MFYLLACDLFHKVRLAVDANLCRCESLQVGIRSAGQQQRKSSGGGGEIVWNLRAVCGECGGGVVQGGEGGVLWWCGV